ncbi:MAG TPA: hypothetical protein DHU96_05625 [Actinobacteria bacterium]|nr:hypothetical protein [Actinomycetota bacterium]
MASVGEWACDAVAAGLSLWPPNTAAGAEMAVRPGVIAGMRRSGAGAELAPRPGAQVLLGVLPFLVMAVVAAVDILAGPRVGFLPLLSLADPLQRLFHHPLAFALIGGLAIMLCVVLAMYDNLEGSRRGFIAFATIAGVTAAGAIVSVRISTVETNHASLRCVSKIRGIPSTTSVP